MQINTQTGHFQRIQFKQGQIVFAQKSNDLVWPALLVKINPSKSLKVKFYLVGGLKEVGESQIWPFNHATIQRFTSEQSSDVLLRAIEAAKKSFLINLQKCQNQSLIQNQLQSLLDKSMQQQDEKDFNINQANIQNIQIPLSQRKGLFLIEQVSQTLQKSIDQTIPQKKSNAPKRQTKYVYKNMKMRQSKKMLQIVPIVCASHPNIRKYTTRYQLKQVQKAEKKQKRSERIIKHAYNESSQQKKQDIQTKGWLNEIDELIRMNVNEIQMNQQITNLHSLTGNKQDENQKQKIIQENVQQQMEQHLLVYGPQNIYDVSTQASLNSVHTFIPPQNQTISTSAQQHLFNSSSSRIIQQISNLNKQAQLSKQAMNIMQNKLEQINNHKQALNKDISDKNVNSFIQILQQLISNLKGERKALSQKQKIKLCQLYEKEGYVFSNKFVIKQMILFVELFQKSENSKKQKCYMQYILIKERLENIILRQSSKKIKNIEQDNITILLCQYKQRKQSGH